MIRSLEKITRTKSIDCAVDTRPRDRHFLVDKQIKKERNKSGRNIVRLYTSCKPHKNQYPVNCFGCYGNITKRDLSVIVVCTGN